MLLAVKLHVEEPGPLGRTSVVGPAAAPVAARAQALVRVARGGAGLERQRGRGQGGGEGRLAVLE